LTNAANEGHMIAIGYLQQLNEHEGTGTGTYVCTHQQHQHQHQLHTQHQQHLPLPFIDLRATNHDPAHVHFLLMHGLSQRFNIATRVVKERSEEQEDTQQECKQV
jgi:hypothetical protein